jgi:uncharacterized glyoxalase superfamily protein PhnB
MKQSAQAIMPFIGSKNFQESCDFYGLLGYEISHISSGFARVYIQDKISFYLQGAYSKEWCENTMVFLEVENLEAQHEFFQSLSLPEKFAGTTLSQIVKQEWGQEFFLHDPAGILWHFGRFC